MTVQQLDLSGRWALHAAGSTDAVPRAVRGRWWPASVPGCVHTDLLAAGAIADPYVGRNEHALQWIGHTDWRYRRTFVVDSQLLAHANVELVCEGLDTVARVEVNGEPAGEGANMHHPHRFDVRDMLRSGHNELSILFRSPIREARRERDRLGSLPWVNALEPYNFIRKMACNFGWDWGPALTTSGIWRPIRIEAWSGWRIEAVRPLVRTADPKRAELEVHVDTVPEGGPRLQSVLRRQGVPVARASSAHGEPMRLQVDRPELWWPRNHGPQPLYELDVEVLDERGERRAAWSGRTGLRTVQLQDAEDVVGRRFAVVVNGEPIFCKGANWIPDDCFLDRACDPERYRHRLEQAAGANMNMLRVWGGGIYESEAFYDLCDALGILVWQDFAFACAAYPEREPHRSRVEAEARHNVARLSRHPSLVLWNGSNENLWGYCDWGWKQGLEKRSWGAGYYFDLLPRVCAELDPSRPYWPSSPYSGAWTAPCTPHPNDMDRGTQHVWEDWSGLRHPVFGEQMPRFCSEFGVQAPANHSTLAAAVGEAEVSPGSPAMRHRQRSERGEANLRTLLHAQFDEPEDPADRLHLLQLVQARAITRCVEWLRSGWPTCTGALYWQLNDCWPAMSWSAIDGGGRPKLLWYATRAFFAPRLLTFQPSALAVHGHVLTAVNDTDVPWSGTLRIERRDFAGGRHAVLEREVRVPARRSRDVLELPSPLLRFRDRRREMLVASLDGVRALWFFGPDRELRYPQPRYDARLEGSGGDYVLELTARALLREVTLRVGRLDSAAVVDRAAVTLLPGETARFRITSTVPLERERLLNPPVLQCSNRFGAR